MINRPDKDGGFTIIQKPEPSKPSVILPGHDSSSGSSSENTNNRPKPPPLGGTILPEKGTMQTPSQKKSNYSSDNNRIKRPRSKLQDTFL